MPSLRSSALAVAAVLLASARADYFIEPDSVDLATRKGWCQSQKTQCVAICQEVDSRPVMVNECSAEELTYGCICGNGQPPDVEEYSLTLPYYTCTEFGNQCVKACGNNNECQRACREDNPCGAQNPSPPNSTATVSSTPSATDDPEETGGVFTGLAGDDTTGAAGALSPLDLGRGYGLAVVLGGLFAGFAML